MGCISILRLPIVEEEEGAKGRGERKDERSVRRKTVSRVCIFFVAAGKFRERVPSEPTSGSRANLRITTVPRTASMRAPGFPGSAVSPSDVIDQGPERVWLGYCFADGQGLARGHRYRLSTVWSANPTERVPYAETSSDRWDASHARPALTPRRSL